MSTLPTTSTLRKREGFLAKPDNHIVEEDYFLQLWKRKLKKKRSNQASARAALYRERLGSWDGHVEVNAVFREPSTGEMSVGQLAWKDSGDVTTHPWKLLKERCPQKVNFHVRIYDHC
jgi:hypothetical protein